MQSSTLRVEDAIQNRPHLAVLGKSPISHTPENDNESAAAENKSSEAASRSSATRVLPLPDRSTTNAVGSEALSPSTSDSTLYEPEPIHTPGDEDSVYTSSTTPSPSPLPTIDASKTVTRTVSRYTLDDPACFAQLDLHLQNPEVVNKLLVLASVGPRSNVPAPVPAPDISQTSEDDVVPEAAFLDRLLAAIPCFSNLKTFAYDFVGRQTTIDNAIFKCIQQLCLVEDLFLGGSFECANSPNTPTNFHGFGGSHLRTLAINYDCRFCEADGHHCWPKSIASLLHSSPELQTVSLTAGRGSIPIKALSLGKLKFPALEEFILAGIDITKHPGDVLESLTYHQHLHALDLDHPKFMARAKQTDPITLPLPVPTELAASVQYIKAAIASLEPGSGLSCKVESLHIRGFRIGEGTESTLSFLRPYTGNVQTAAITFAPDAAFFIDDFVPEFRWAFPNATSIAWYTLGQHTKIYPKYASEACKWIEPFAAFKGLTTFRPLDLILQYAGLRGPSVGDEVTLGWLRNFAAFIPSLRIVDGSPNPGTTLPYYESVRINQVGKRLQVGWRVDRTLVDRTTGATFEIVTPFPQGSRPA